MPQDSELPLCMSRDNNMTRVIERSQATKKPIRFASTLVQKMKTSFFYSQTLIDNKHQAKCRAFKSKAKQFDARVTNLFTTN